jgi:hypothetical protein
MTDAACRRNGSLIVTGKALYLVVQNHLAEKGEERAGLSPERFDSSARAVREVALALGGGGQGVLEPYPPGSSLFLGLTRLLPEELRIKAIEWGLAQFLGRETRRLESLRPTALPRWCVAQYPPKEYGAIIVGSPSGAVAHLAALLEAPFLTSSFLLSFRNRIAPDDLQSYLRFGEGLAARLLERDEDFEAINHYDPLHDRSLIKYADLLRLRLVRLPQAYREFIRTRLVAGGYLVLINCRYPWPQYRLSERSSLQVGGLGGVSPSEFLNRWSLQLPLEERPESEWGCPPGLAEDVRQFAQEKGLRLIELEFDHPQNYSLLAYRAYRAAGAREDELVLDCFTYSNPYTNVATGIPALWLPYHDRASFAFARRFLEDKHLVKIYLALAPSFARCEDTVTFAGWEGLLRGRGRLELLGVEPRSYPADPWAPFAYSAKLARLREHYPQDQQLRLAPQALEGLTEEPELG